MSAVGGIVSDYTATLAVRKLDRLLNLTLFHINNDYWTKLFVVLLDYNLIMSFTNQNIILTKVSCSYFYHSIQVGPQELSIKGTC